MITQISLIGFKSFLNRTIDLKPLTILTGLNSSGKSSVIQALLMLEKAYNGHQNILLENHGSVADLTNPFHNKPIHLDVIDHEDKEFGVDFPSLSNTKAYVTSSNSGFEFPEIIYISANRFGPKTSVPIFNDSTKSNRVGPNGENLFQFIRSFESETVDQRLIHSSSEGETIEYNIRGWLSEISPNVKFNYKIDEISDTSYSTFNNFRATNVGFGLSYSLAVIATLLIGTLIPNSLIIIENPEAHLHPRGQSALARLISLCAQVGSMIIIETHSDHLFDGIRIAAKKTEGFADTVQIHWFELNEKYNTDIESPNLLSTGALDHWPKGLFDQFEINASELL